MSRPLRILVAHNVPSDQPGGMNRIMRFTHDEFTGDGHRVEYFCSEELPHSMRGFPARFAFPWLVRRHVARAAGRGEPYDIVNVHEPVAALTAAYRAGLGGATVVVTTHGVERRAWELALEEGRLGRGGPTARSRVVYPSTVLWQANLALRRADNVFCLNEEDRSYLIDRLGIPGERTTRIFPGARELHGARATSRDYGRASKLLFAGTWRHNKGIVDLVPAFAALAGRHRDISLTVLGPGIPEAEVRAAFPPGLRDRVTAMNSPGDETTATTMAAHDVFVLPSLFEGTPLTLMEAMASALPIVTTATCGMRDVIDDGRNGLLVPIRRPDAIVNAIDRILKDRELRARMGRASHEDWATRYTWEAVSAPILNTYLDLAR